MTTTLPHPATLRLRFVGADAPASAPFVDGQLRLGLLVDLGEGERPVTEDDLAAWQTTPEALVALARIRLVGASDRSEWIAVDTVPGMALYQALDGQSSTRALVLDHLVGEWPLAGVAVAVPSEDQLIAVPLNEVEDLDALNVLVTAAHVAWETADRPLTDQAFWFDGTRWYHIDVAHDGDEVTVTLPAPARLAIERLAAMGLVAMAGEA